MIKQLQDTKRRGNQPQAARDQRERQLLDKLEKLQKAKSEELQKEKARQELRGLTDNELLQLKDSTQAEADDLQAECAQLDEEEQELLSELSELQDSVLDAISLDDLESLVSSGGSRAPSRKLPSKAKSFAFRPSGQRRDCDNAEQRGRQKAQFFADKVSLELEKKALERRLADLRKLKGNDNSRNGSHNQHPFLPELQPSPLIMSRSSPSNRSRSRTSPAVRSLADIPKHLDLPEPGTLQARLRDLREECLQNAPQNIDTLAEIRHMEEELRSLEAAKSRKRRSSTQSMTSHADWRSLQLKMAAYEEQNKQLLDATQQFKALMAGNASFVSHPGRPRTVRTSDSLQLLNEEHNRSLRQLRHQVEVSRKQVEAARHQLELKQLQQQLGTLTVGMQTSTKPSSSTSSDAWTEPSPYDPGAGFAVLWDFVVGVPFSMFSHCQLRTAVYRKESLLSEGQELPVVPCSDAMAQAPDCMVLDDSLLCTAHFYSYQRFPGRSPLISLSLHTELLSVELDFGDETQHQRAWTKIDLFDEHHRLLSGRSVVSFTHIFLFTGLRR